MKILLTGGSGQLGQEILKSKPKAVEIINPTRNQLDLSDYKSCIKIVIDYKPDWIINCAAFTQVDDAEKNATLSQQINSYAPAAFAEVVNKINTNLLHISTDFVFDGNQNFPYEESQKRNPLSQYGSSKALGEELIEKNIQNIEKATILRTSWVISPRGRNFVLTMLKLHSEKDTINVVSDQIGSPTYADDIANDILKIINNKKFIKNTMPSEIYHYSNLGEVSWHDFAKEIFKIAKLDCKVLPIKTSSYPTPAKRPLNTILNKDKIVQEFEINLSFWKDSLKKNLTN